MFCCVKNTKILEVDNHRNAQVLKCCPANISSVKSGEIEKLKWM